MKAIMVMFDSLNRHMLSPYGCDWTRTENFERLAQRTVVFDNCWVGSMPCMPARRELHTGRYNFLHRSWGPLEPFDDSMPQILKDAGIHTHLVSDHYHYWEDGGATYHQRYTTWECVRGQEGDNWQPLVGFKKVPESTRNVCGEPEDNWVGQDFANRTVMTEIQDQPQSRTFQKGWNFWRKIIKRTTGSCRLRHLILMNLFSASRNTKNSSRIIIRDLSATGRITDR